MESLRLAPGGRDDLATVLGLIEEAKAWLRVKDRDQWAKPWPDTYKRDSAVLGTLRAGKTWIVWDGDIPAATVTLATRHNPDVWVKSHSRCDLSERAIYVHRLVVARKYAGLGLGAQLVDWAGLHACHDYGAEWIRIEVWSMNEALHAYYRRHGFEFCGMSPDPNYPSGALFQKPVLRIANSSLSLLSETPAAPISIGRPVC